MISVLVPTRGRVDRLQTMLDSYDATSTPGASELIFRIDDDDWDTWKCLNKSNRFMIRGLRGRGYADLPKMFNQLSKLASGDLLMCGNDDMVFKTPGWDRRLQKVADNYPDGLFDLGVTTYNDTAIPFSCVSRQLVDRLGFLNDERLLYSDVYLRDVAQHFDRALLVPTIEIQHDWVGFGDGSEREEVRMKEDEVLRDRDTYWRLHEQCVQEAVVKLEGMIRA